MNSALKIALAAAAVVAVVAAGSYLMPRQGGVGGQNAATPSPTASPSPRPISSPQSAHIKVAGSALQLTAELPAGWAPFEFGAGDDTKTQPITGTTFFASIVDNTFSDPCAHVQRSPKIGSTVEARAAALGEIPNITATAPVRTTLAGRDATYVELTIPASLPCSPDQFYLWQDSPDADWWVLAPNEVVRVWILGAGGEAVAIAARSFPGTSEESKAQLQEVLNSIVFDGTTPQPSTSPAAS
jgi:hypothetical protein